MSGRTKKPNTVFLTPFNYDVIWTKSRGNSSHGETSTDLKQITINPVGPEEATKETLIHEICHVLVEDLIDVLLHTELKADDAEELFIRLMSPRIYEFIKHNNEITSYIQGE